MILNLIYRRLLFCNIAHFEIVIGETDFIGVICLNLHSSLLEFLQFSYQIHHKSFKFELFKQNNCSKKASLHYRNT